ncbi:hypothetical protein [Yoonia sp. I 8.24]|uniref:hypothetical protein n=1 Tax=Yoonia sp. I 8.24 TaxID=1537229 RepID=UPI001EE1038F|nr:hypothetical protein [Yoonia sp. I 8.24]MCG3266294.1 hypothetical protein [Yoonia sp. I 8.24]
MPKSAKISFVLADAQVQQPVTKFGGQPVWIGAPTWPIDDEFGEQMIFVAQFALTPDLFPGSKESVVYLFVAASEPVTTDTTTCIVQSAHAAIPATCKTTPELTGPSVITLRDEVEEQLEYAVTLQTVDEPTVALADRFTKSELSLKDGYQFRHTALAGCKLAGQPIYVEQQQAPEYFRNPDWVHICQLAPDHGYFAQFQPNFYPFVLELGEYGLLNVFINTDGTRAVAYVQSL